MYQENELQYITKKITKDKKYNIEIAEALCNTFLKNNDRLFKTIHTNQILNTSNKNEFEWLIDKYTETKKNNKEKSLYYYREFTTKLTQNALYFGNKKELKSNLTKTINISNNLINEIIKKPSKKRKKYCEILTKKTKDHTLLAKNTKQTIELFKETIKEYRDPDPLKKQIRKIAMKSKNQILKTEKTFLDNFDKKLNQLKQKRKDLDKELNKYKSKEQKD
jgi:hypothetical protein